MSCTNKISLCAKVELCAALLGVKLVEAVTNAISDEQFPTPKVFAWSDSTVTIALLQDYPANSCKYVPTENISVDCASRGLAAADLLKHKLSWNGPY